MVSYSFVTYIFLVFLALGSSQPLTEMSTRSTSWGIKLAVPKADNLTTIMCQLSWILGASTSRTLRSCPGLLWDCCTFICL